MEGHFWTRSYSAESDLVTAHHKIANRFAYRNVPRNLNTFIICSTLSNLLSTLASFSCDVIVGFFLCCVLMYFSSPLSHLNACFCLFIYLWPSSTLLGWCMTVLRRLFLFCLSGAHALKCLCVFSNHWCLKGTDLRAHVSVPPNHRFDDSVTAVAQIGIIIHKHKWIWIIHSATY